MGYTYKGTQGIQYERRLIINYRHSTKYTIVLQKSISPTRYLF